MRCCNIKLCPVSILLFKVDKSGNGASVYLITLKVILKSLFLESDSDKKYFKHCVQLPQLLTYSGRYFQNLHFSSVRFCFKEIFNTISFKMKNFKMATWVIVLKVLLIWIGL